jgi:hypothetical protein
MRIVFLKKIIYPVFLVSASPHVKSESSLICSDEFAVVKQAQPLNPHHKLTFSFFEIHFNLSSQQYLGLPSDLTLQSSS